VEYDESSLTRWAMIDGLLYIDAASLFRVSSRPDRNCTRHLVVVVVVIVVVHYLDVPMLTRVDHLSCFESRHCYHCRLRIIMMDHRRPRLEPEPTYSSMP